MKYLLDTNICIYLIKNNNNKLISKITSFAPGELCISSVTTSELYYGARKSMHISKNLTLLEDFLSGFTVLPYDNDDAIFYGIIRADLERKGTPIGPLDNQIGAQALAKEMTIVTNNEKEFIRIENLKVENWSL